MHARAFRWLLPAVLASCALVLSVRDARADMSPKVIKAFKGQLIISADRVEPGANDKATIAAYKAARLKEVKGDPNADGVQTWHFHYTAFLKKKASGGAVSLDFYDGSKLVDNPNLEGVDTSVPVLEGDIDVTEDDGPAKGKKYTLKLVVQEKGKDVVLATTDLTMN